MFFDKLTFPQFGIVLGVLLIILVIRDIKKGKVILYLGLNFRWLKLNGSYCYREDNPKGFWSRVIFKLFLALFMILISLSMSIIF